MAEVSFEEVVDEQTFVGLLQENSLIFFRLARTLACRKDEEWNRKHYFQLHNEADDLESFLDDYGARLNRSYHYFRELVACMRGFAQAGHSISHLLSRLESYGVERQVGSSEHLGFLTSIQGAGVFIREATVSFLGAAIEEARGLGVNMDADTFPEEYFAPVHARQRLPRNIDEEEPRDERHKIAEVAAKYLQACDMLGDLQIRRIEDADERASLLGEICSEEHARVYEATVHNLQSSYDTYLKNTVLETKDERLPQLRGHVSASLHTLQSVTCLAHFVERHENDIRSEQARERISALVDRGEVQDWLLNQLLFWAERVMSSGRALAGALLPEYTNAKELEVELAGDVVLHARPAALIVGIVNRYGTPVEMEVAEQRCNAASILELLVAVGSNPDQRRFLFRGDENPLRDIAVLFQYGLGEQGVENLPPSLSYLRAK